MIKEAYHEAKRTVVLWLSALFGMVTSVAQAEPASAADKFEFHSIKELCLLVWERLPWEQLPYIILGATVGGAIGLIYYIITYFIKRALFKIFPIEDKQKEKEIEDLKH